jgi:hypothetical protein
MFNISQFFARAEQAGLKELRYREEVAKIISRHLGVEIPMSSISTDKNAVITVKAHPGAKNGLFMRKDRILKEIRETLPNVPVTDLR